MVWRGPRGHDLPMPLPADLDQLDAQTLRRLLVEQDRELVWRQTKIERLTHELALHKRHRFGVRAERLSSEQAQLFEETVEADLAAMSQELEQLQPDTGKRQAPKGQARRKPLPPELPRTEITKNAFVLLPLADIAGGEQHPLLLRSYTDLWRDYDKASQPLWRVDFVWRDQLVSTATS